MSAATKTMRQGGELGDSPLSPELGDLKRGGGQERSDGSREVNVDVVEVSLAEGNVGGDAFGSEDEGKD